MLRHLILIGVLIFVSGCVSEESAMNPHADEDGISDSMTSETKNETVIPRIPAVNDTQIQDTKTTEPSEIQSTKIIMWEWDMSDTLWKSSAPAPACPPLVFDSPVDIRKATSMLYPGQYRPDYKPHG